MEATVIWITGLSGSGKTTIARRLVEMLKERGEKPVLIDGDEIRDAIRDPSTAHDRDSRIQNALRICRLTELLSSQGFMVIVATMSLFKEVHEWNRSHFPSYFEVYLDVRLDVLRKRHPHDLYTLAEQGKTADVAGIDLAFDRPLNPHLVLPNDSEGGVDEAAQKILGRLGSSLPGFGSKGE